MKGLAAVLCSAFAAVAAAAQTVDVPSGQPVEFLEVVRDLRGSRGLTWRFRFVAPQIARDTGTVSFEEAAQDMDHLCREFALPRLPNIGPRPRQIVVSLSATPVRFGTTDPENTQFFEVYRVEDNQCIWEGF